MFLLSFIGLVPSKEPGNEDLELVAMSAEISKQPTVYSGLDSNCDNLLMTVEMTVAPMEQPIVPQHNVWPSWSLPPPDKKQIEETSANQSNSDSTTVSGAEVRVDESGYFLDCQNKEARVMASVDLTSSPANCLRSETGHKKEECSNKTCTTVSAVHGLGPDSSLQLGNSVRPATPEQACSHLLHKTSSLVTGRRHSLAARDSASDEELDDSELLQETGHPAESYDITENNGLLDELKKVNIKFTFLT